ncbi:MAG: ATP-binding protein [Methylococcales bacterium]
MSQNANFKVDPRLAKLLGESYRSTESALKELVDNARDAEATVISITLPDRMTLDPILIEDNGNGVTEQELRLEYLTVANDRRSRSKADRTPRLNRLVKGRKGIGKFAGLMVANIFESARNERVPPPFRYETAKFIISSMGWFLRSGATRPVIDSNTMNNKKLIQYQ